jgi:hypothetical protein
MSGGNPSSFCARWPNKTVRLLGIATALGLIAGPAPAQDRFVGQLGIYSLEPPPGWGQEPKPSYADAVFAPPGGMSRGSISVGLQAAKATLEDEADMGAMGGRYWGRERMTIDGASCIREHTEQEFEHNFFACHITVRFREGPMNLVLFADGGSPPGSYEAQTEIFDTLIRTIRWGSSVIAQ